MLEIKKERVYALVVGIEEYDSSKISPLNGAANDALQFREWLDSRGVERDNIFSFSHLCLIIINLPLNWQSEQTL